MPNSSSAAQENKSDTRSQATPSANNDPNPQQTAGVATEQADEKSSQRAEKQAAADKLAGHQRSTSADQQSTEVVEELLQRNVQLIGELASLGQALAESVTRFGIDKSADRETKGAYSFPYGDFRRVHRSGVISAESRAGQHDHLEIRDALKKLLDLIDKE